jgi:hypothetical protein
MRSAAKALAYLVVVLCLSEAGMRVIVSRDADKREASIVTRRLIDVWHRPKPSEMEPPFLTFADKGFDDPARMRLVAENAKLPPNGSWRARDFLLPGTAAGAAYSVRSNSLGFRGPERSRVKPPGVYRVLMLGSYGTFGHGVEEEDSLPSRLERVLNKNGHGRRFEVWNAGHESSTAIAGLALLRREAFEYHPDLIILDYGFVDLSLGEDDFSLIGTRARARLLAALDRLAARSELYLAFITLYRPKAAAAHNRRQWKEAMDLSLREIERRRVPAILIDQAWSVPLRPDYEDLVRGHRDVRYVSLLDLISRAPVPPEALAAFRAGENWTSEYGPGYDWGQAPLFADCFQLNRWGYRIAADALAEKILETATAR